MRILSIDGHYEMELIEFGCDIFLLSTAQKRTRPIRLFFFHWTQMNLGFIILGAYDFND